MSVPTELDVAEDKVAELEALLLEVRDSALALYSMRGEDEVTARHCNYLFKLTEDIAP